MRGVRRRARTDAPYLRLLSVVVPGSLILLAARQVIECCRIGRIHCRIVVAIENHPNKFIRSERLPVSNNQTHPSDNPLVQSLALTRKNFTRSASIGTSNPAGPFVPITRTP